ncbi:MAG: strawberry notch family protein [Muribaculaceae bacterium]|nr:strawberry notch family protein [Muribaculaceae bacterium]
MTIHTQLRGFVDRYGADMLRSPYLTAIMADEKIFSDPDNRSFKQLFRQMVNYDHVRQLASLWRTGVPTASTYSTAYPGVEYENLRYAIDCIGYALGKIDNVSTTSGKSGEITQTVELEAETVDYISHGSSDNIGTLIPAVMAQPVHRHLNAIANEEGSVIEFVRSEMCEPSADEIRKKISGEQIDGVALAMRQMIDGRAFILGDMTGIGKGRQLAMLLKWAQRHGEKPVFVTEKSILFNDIYRDLKDIGYDDMRPFILNNDTAARITDSFGNIVYNLPSTDEMEEFKKTGSIPAGYDFLLTTYSQLNKNPQKSWKPKAVLSAIKDTYLILDESHNATGIDSNVGQFFQLAVQEARGVCFASATYAKYPSSMPIYALKTAMGDAKIPASDLLEIISHGGPILQEVMAQGLVESGSMIRRQRDMSEVERRLDTPTDPTVIDSLRCSYDKIIDLINDIREFHKQFLRVYTDSQDPVAILNGKFKIKPSERWDSSECQIKEWNPQQRLSPTIRQLLFVLKTDFAVEKTLEEIRSGRKPIVQISRTMASSISRILNVAETCDSPDFALILQNCVEDMFQYEVIGKTTRTVGKKTLTSSYSTSCRYSFCDVIDYFNSPEWIKSGIVDNPAETAANAQGCYDLLIRNIKSALTGLPLSPIDYFVQRLTAEGLRVAELTQRSIRLVYDDVNAGANSRVTCKVRKNQDKKQAANDFNNGKIDVLIGNKVMASGISLHNSEGFADTRPRTVITWEQQESADVQTQFDGRADRTGQLDHCRYIVLVSPIPTEQRYLMLNSRKQRSLNANVEANQGTDKICADMFNKYGAKVIEEFIADNPEFADTATSAYVSQSNSSFRKPKLLTDGKCAQFVSFFMRDLGLLTCQEQDTILTEILSRYNQLMNSLEENGENELMTNVLPLQAELMKRQVFLAGKKDAISTFAGDANLDEYEVNVLRKPLTAAQIREYMSVLSDEKALIPKIEAATDTKVDNIKRYYTELRARALQQLAQLTVTSTFTPSRVRILEDRANNNDRMQNEIANVRLSKDNLVSQLHYFSIGRTYSIPQLLIADGQTDDPSYASMIPVGIFMGYKVIGDKYTRSAIHAVFAVNDSRSVVRVSMADSASLKTIISQSSYGRCLSHNCKINLSNWDSLVMNRTREKAYIITGNILSGIARCKQLSKNVNKSKMARIVVGMTVGRMIKFTDIHGNICTGYMLRGFHPQTFFNNITI